MKIIITEDQLEKIIVNYDWKLFEQSTPTIQQKKFPTQMLGTMFGYGKYVSPEVKQHIINLKPQIEQFIKESDSRQFYVTITAGESLVTNPPGFEVKGSLALARANEIKKYFQEIFPELVKNNILIINSPKTIKDVTIGTTPYKQYSNQQNDPILKPKYEKEQFVNFDIVGTGEKKTTPPQQSDDFCQKGVKEAKGAVIPSSQNFTEIVEWDLGEGEGDFFIYYDTIYMPDILYFEYNGVTYPKDSPVNFRGTNTLYMRILVGTALNVKYKGSKLGPQFGNTTYQSINIDNKQYKDALLEARSQSWNFKESFTNVYGSDQEFYDEEIMNELSEFDETGNVNKLVRTLGKKINWGILTSPILPGLVKNIPMTKIKGVNTVKIVNVAPNGETRWRVATTCKEF